MPVYDYQCRKCEKVFTTRMSFKEYETKEVKCPDCGSKRVERLVASVNVKTSRKS